MPFIRRMEKMWHIFTMDFLSIKKWNYVISGKMNGTLLLWARRLYLLYIFFSTWVMLPSPLLLVAGFHYVTSTGWLGPCDLVASGSWVLTSQACLSLLDFISSFGAADRAREERNQAQFCVFSFFFISKKIKITSKEVLGFICDSFLSQQSCDL